MPHSVALEMFGPSSAAPFGQNSCALPSCERSFWGELQGITRDYTPFLLILQGMSLQLQGITLSHARRRRARDEGARFAQLRAAPGPSPPGTKIRCLRWRVPRGSPGAHGWGCGRRLIAHRPAGRFSRGTGCTPPRNQEGADPRGVGGARVHPVAREKRPAGL